jgi:hypothetical protein
MAAATTRRAPHRRLAAKTAQLPLKVRAAGDLSMRFLGRWLTDALNLALALLGAIAMMQAPALTQAYAAALLQVARDAHRDTDQRMASARQFYSIATDTDDGFVAALRGFEPSNAETLAAALDRARRIGAAYDRIAQAGPLLQPLVALWQAISDRGDDTAIVRRTLAETYDPQVTFRVAALIYGLAGLLLGTLAARLVLVAGGGLFRLAVPSRAHRPSAG